MILQFGGGAVRPPELRLRQRRLPRGASDCWPSTPRLRRVDEPREWYTIEGWADDGAGLLDALGLDRVLVHGTSMGGMIAIAFTAKYPRARDRGVRRRRVREARPLPARRSSASGGGWPRRMPLGRLLRPRHNTGGRRGVPREQEGKDTFDDGALGDRARTRPVHRAAGVPRDGGRWTSRRSCRRSSGRC